MNMDVNKKFLEGLSEEMLAKVAACETAQDLVDLADAQGVELTDDQLEQVSGGSWGNCFNCGDTSSNFGY